MNFNLVVYIIVFYEMFILKNFIIQFSKYENLSTFSYNIDLKSPINSFDDL